MAHNLQSTNNAWEIFSSRRIESILIDQAYFDQLILYINTQMNLYKNELNDQFPAHYLAGLAPRENLQNYTITINKIITANTGLVIEFTENYLGIRRQILHTTFHRIPDAGNSPSHIQLDLDGKTHFVNLFFNYDLYGNVSLDSNDAQEYLYTNSMRQVYQDIFKIAVHGLELMFQNFVLNRALIQQPQINRRMSNNRGRREYDATNKYLKYKQKYLELKKLLGSMNIKN